MVAQKIRVGLVFGGRSGEHEVSLRSARSILDALDRERYEPVLIGIDHDGRWHLQQSALALLDAPGTPLALDPAAPALAVAPGGDASPGSLVQTSLAAVGAAPRGALHAATAAASPRGVGQVDVFFPVLHGTYGEDGTLQGLMEMVGVPYVGSGVLGSAAGMDKDVAKRLLRDAGLPVVDGFSLRASQDVPVEEITRRVETSFGWPVFVKPANMGSSVGVSRVKGPGELPGALATAFRYDGKLLVEQGLAVREVECAVLGNEHPEASVVGEIVPSHDFYSYEAKYLDEHGAALVIPADLPAGRSDEIRAMAVRAFQCLELSGLARVDFFIEKGSGRVYVNEVNTLPGFTTISMYPKLWAATGLSYGALVDRLIALALERHQARQALSTRYVPGV